MTARFDEALKVALLKLKRTDLFEEEIRSFLRAEDPTTIEQVVEWLNKHGCLNEKRTVESAIKKREGKRAVAFSRLEQELSDRGAASDLVHSLRPEGSDSEAAYALLTVRYKPLWKERGKAARFLCSRGFEEDAVTSAIDRFFGESEWVADGA